MSVVVRDMTPKVIHLEVGNGGSGVFQMQDPPLNLFKGAVIYVCRYSSFDQRAQCAVEGSAP